MPGVQNITDPEQMQTLLRIARQTAETELGVRDSSTSETESIEGRFGGAFVTFWSGKGLRGCVGSFATTDHIVDTIREVTRNTLTDSRFVANPIVAAELPSLDIEISLLSNLTPTDDPLSLIPGTHGIVVRQGAQSGCFLPKVASERGWGAEQFLSNCCTMKAGLPSQAWREPDTTVLLFTAQVFSESRFL